MKTNMENIIKYAPLYKDKYFKAFNKKATSWWGFQKWLADSNIAHTFEMNETSKCIELFE